MTDSDHVYETIYNEITRDDPEIRNSFLNSFQKETNEFTQAMSDAFTRWRNLDGVIGGDKKKAFVSGLVYTTIFLHIQSMKAFLSGHIIASGNLQRQVVESIALTILCSHKSLRILERCTLNKYESNYAIGDLAKHNDVLKLKPEAIDELKKARKFYHNYSHPTSLTMAIHIPFNSNEDGIYVGASFDEGKLGSYLKTIEGMVSLASVFSSFINVVHQNVLQW